MISGLNLTSMKMVSIVSVEKSKGDFTFLIILTKKWSRENKLLYECSYLPSFCLQNVRHYEIAAKMLEKV